MSCFSLRLSTLHSHFRHARHDRFWQRFGYEAKNRRFPIIRVKSVRKISATRNVSSSCSLISYPPALEIDAEDSSLRQILGEEVETYRSDSLENYDIKEERERRRREKIGLANKHRVPWNKGKQHDEETRERIKQRTIEALKNPKVRQKMVECRRPHSDQVKNKIGSTQKRVWAKRLKSKRSRMRFFHLWTKCIAEAAKTGGVEEETLAWNRYEKLKEEMRQMQLNRDAENEKHQVLEKIGSTQNRVRAKRLNSERSRMRFIHLWAKCIAAAAKTGGVEEETLAWNRYEKIKEEMCQMQLNRDAENEKHQVLEKIGSTQNRVRAKRLNSKRSRMRFFHLWAKCIAEAAKTGSVEEETLAWNSYEKIKEEMRQMQLNRDAENEKHRVLKKIRTSKKRVRVREKHMEIARKSKLREEKKKKKEEIAEEKRRLRRGRRDSKNRLRLKERLSQIRQKISRNSEVSSLNSSVSPHTSVLENMDLELIKSEISQKRVSLADQIKAAKSKKAEFTSVDSPEPRP